MDFSKINNRSLYIDSKVHSFTGRFLNTVQKAMLTLGCIQPTAHTVNGIYKGIINVK